MGSEWWGGREGEDGERANNIVHGKGTGACVVGAAHGWRMEASTEHIMYSSFVLAILLSLAPLHQAACKRPRSFSQQQHAQEKVLHTCGSVFPVYHTGMNNEHAMPCHAMPSRVLFNRVDRPCN